MGFLFLLQNFCQLQPDAQKFLDLVVRGSHDSIVFGIVQHKAAGGNLGTTQTTEITWYLKLKRGLHQTQRMRRKQNSI